jgi:hypothetical protein
MRQEDALEFNQKRRNTNEYNSLSKLVVGAVRLVPLRTHCPQQGRPAVTVGRPPHADRTGTGEHPVPVFSYQGLEFQVPDGCEVIKSRIVISGRIPA